MVDLLPVHQLLIRHAGFSDLPGLEWDGEYTHFRRLFAEAYRLVERGEAIMWIAELPEIGIVGQIFVQMLSQNTDLADGEGRAYLYGFRVRQGYQRAGIGSRLLETAEQDLIRRGFQVFSLNVGRFNHEARQLYERKGYRIVAAEPGIWSYVDHLGERRQVNEPAWRMEKRVEN